MSNCPCIRGKSKHILLLELPQLSDHPTTSKISMRKSFESYDYKSSPSGNPLDLERQPILFPDSIEIPSNQADSVVNNDGNSNSCNPIWRDSSYNFSSDAELVNLNSMSKQNQNAGMVTDDPPSQLIRKFLHKQSKNSGSEVFLDMVLDMDVDIQKNPSASASAASPSPSRSAASKDFRSFKQTTFKTKPSPYASDDSEAEVLRCTANTYRRNTSLLRPKARSRLMDPPPLPCGVGAETKKHGWMPARRSTSTMLGTVDGGDDDEDDDIPDDFKSDRISFMTVLQWASLILILAGLASTLALAPARAVTVWSLHLWKWEVLVLVLICGRLLSGWCIRIGIFFIQRSFLLRKRILYFVYGVRRAVQNCFWLGLVLLSWHFILEQKTNNKALSYVTKALLCLLFATLLRLLKTLIVKVLASSFHVSAYFDRIQDSLFNQYVVETLSGPPHIEIENYLLEEEEVLADVQMFQNAGATIPNELKAAGLPPRSSRPIGYSGNVHGTPKSSLIGKSIAKKSAGRQDEGITIDLLHKLNQKNVSAWNMKRLMRTVRHGTLSTLEEQIPQASGEDESVVTVRSEHEAKIAARRIFQNVAKSGAKYIYLVDLMRFMSEEETLKTISLFKDAKENKISRKSLKDWVVNAFRERRALALTLNDTKTAVNKLHQIGNVLVGVIVFVICLFILGIATTHFFVFMSSQVVLVVIIFGNTLKMTFEAIVFLFVMHPFDVGDRCEVDGEEVIVEEMNILTTVFLKGDNTKVSYPNTLLATKPISNYYRSPDQGDAIDFCVNVSTPVEKLALMKEKIIRFMESKKEYWYPGAMVVLRDVDDMNKLKMSIWFQHRTNFQDMGLKFTRRELLLQELIRILREQDIEYRMLPVDVNCRSLPALSSARLPSTWASNV